MNALDQLDAYLIGAWNAERDGDAALLAAYTALADTVLGHLEELVVAKRAEVERFKAKVRGDK